LTAPHCILSKVELKFSFYLGHGFKDFSRLMVEPQTSGFIVINSGLSCLGSTDIAKSPRSHGKWSFVAVTDVFWRRQRCEPSPMHTSTKTTNYLCGLSLPD
jgi:hypothetical protein